LVGPLARPCLGLPHSRAEALFHLTFAHFAASTSPGDVPLSSSGQPRASADGLRRKCAGLRPWVLETGRLLGGPDLGCREAATQPCRWGRGEVDRELPSRLCYRFTRLVVFESLEVRIHSELRFEKKRLEPLLDLRRVLKGRISSAGANRCCKGRHDRQTAVLFATKVSKRSAVSWDHTQRSAWVLMRLLERSPSATLQNDPPVEAGPNGRFTGFPLVLLAGRPTTARLQTPARGDNMRLACPGTQTVPPARGQTRWLLTPYYV
jgi:hypothetical protein